MIDFRFEKLFLNCLPGKYFYPPLTIILRHAGPFYNLLVRPFDGGYQDEAHVLGSILSG